MCRLFLKPFVIRGLVARLTQLNGKLFCQQGFTIVVTQLHLRIKPPKPPQRYILTQIKVLTLLPIALIN